MVLVSNNLYHIATPRHLGRRFSLAGGVLGAIVVERSSGSPPAQVPRLLREAAERGATPGHERLVTWSAAQVTLHGGAPSVVAGVDGEALSLPLPLTCEIRPRALCVLLPPGRPGIPREPRPPRPPRRPGQRP